MTEFANGVGSALLIAALWLGIVSLLSRVGGWSRVAESYAAHSPFPGRVFRFRSIRFGRWLSYNNSVTLGADPSGLYIAAWGIFRFGHPPLFIPWPDVRVVFHKRLWISGVMLKLAQAPEVPLAITSRTARRLAAESGGAFLAPMY